MAKRAGSPPWPVTLTPTTGTDVDLHEVVAHIRQSGFSGLCGVEPDNSSIDMSVRAKNPQAARERTERLLEPNFEGLFTIGLGPL
jgi:sugar phosphate isomerase/epimerase